MIRGTTPTHTFTLPFDASLVAKCKIIYAQDEVEIFHKNTEDCVLSGTTIATKLTQEETFMLDCHKCVDIQVRVLTTTGDALASVPKKVGVAKCLDNEVLA